MSPQPAMGSCPANGELGDIQAPTAPQTSGGLPCPDRSRAGAALILCEAATVQFPFSPRSSPTRRPLVGASKRGAPGRDGVRAPAGPASLAPAARGRPLAKESSVARARARTMHTWPRKVSEFMVGQATPVPLHRQGSRALGASHSLLCPGIHRGDPASQGNLCKSPTYLGTPSSPSPASQQARL